MLGVMLRGGFSYDLGHRALLGSRALGFSQELFEPSTPAESEEALAAMGEHVPNLVAMAAEAAHGTTGKLGFCDYQAEFEFGLDLVLDGLDRLNAAS
ncbi:hypothetical protein GCM10029992_08440 [Glycomyces albus]